MSDDPAAGWLRSLDQLFPIPAAYRNDEVSREDALAMLRCGDDVLDRLVDAGLPCTGEEGRERFDRYDLFNLALYSGSGASQPELGFQFALRWMSGPSDLWFQPKRWTVSTAVACGRPEGCQGDATSTLARPMPELCAGTLGELSVEPDGADVGPERISVGGDGELSLACEVETVGERLELRAPEARSIVRDFMQTEYRWVRLPEALQRDPEAVLVNGVSNCITASIHLERIFRAAGFQATTRRGWILGVLDLEHAWVEVVDEDGVAKAVDPVFVLLSRVAEDPAPDFEEVCMGSMINRLLPTAHEAHQPLASHVCGGGEAPMRRRTAIRAARRAGVAA